MVDNADTGPEAAADLGSGVPPRSDRWLKFGIGPVIAVGVGGGTGVGAIFGQAGLGAGVGAAVGVMVGAWMVGWRRRSG